MNQSFNLHKFKPENIKSSDLIYIIGHRNSGKSTLIKDLLFKSHQVPFGRVINTSEEYNHFYRYFIPSILIQNEFEDKEIKKMFEEKKKLYKEKEDGKEIDNRSFFVFEECIHSKEEIQNKSLLKLIERKNIYQNLIFISSVWIFILSPDVHKKIDYIFLYREQIVKERKKIYERYGKMIPNYQMFEDIFIQCTENDYECLVIHLSNPSTNWMDKIYWYKADIHENVKLCERKWWKESKIIHSFKKIKRFRKII